MRGDQVLERHQLFHGLLEAVKRRASGVGFITLHQGSPLACTHTGGARIGQQIDQHIIRVQGKQVVVGILDILLTLLWRGHTYGLDGFDSEWLDDRFHGSILTCAAGVIDSIWPVNGSNRDIKC